MSKRFNVIVLTLTLGATIVVSDIHTLITNSPKTIYETKDVRPGM
ncbi:hypothetical protein BACPU_11260 [Bacillus pumilus]|nr:hypothetical protein BACPU_11260 [Bacillus pumilus]